MKIHYFGDNIKKRFYRKWNRFQVECGIYIEDRALITNIKEDVTCGNCKKILKF